MADVTDGELAEPKQRWTAERAERPVPATVRLDAVSERIVVDFTNGASFIFPARALEGLQDATIEQLAEVELLGETGLHCESLDADFTLSGLMSGIFGTKTFMDAQRQGGQSRSQAKAAAGQADGGRPRGSLNRP